MKKLAALSLWFNFFGTVALAKGLLLTNKQIDAFSGTYWDQNLYLKQSFISNRHWAIAGFILIGIGLISQIISVARGK